MHGVAPRPGRPAWPRAARVVGIVIGLVLLLTGMTKLLDISGFAAVVGSYQVLPAGLHLPTAVAIMLAELVLAVWLISGWRLLLGAAAALLLHLAYLAWSLVGVLRGLSIPNCGCFGTFWPRPLGWATVAEDAVLSLLCGLLILIAPRGGRI